MHPLEIGIRIAAGILLLLANAFYVVTEFALTRLPQFDRERVEGEGSLRTAWEMTERLEIYLTSCQVGITTTSILLGVVAEPAVTVLLRPATAWLPIPEGAMPAVSIALAVGIMNLAHTVWGEQTPTYLGVERPLAVLRWTAVPHRWWTRIVYPLIWVGDHISKLTLAAFGVRMRRSWTEAGEEAGAAKPVGRTEMRRRMGEVLAAGRLPEDRQREVLQALAIDEIPVRDIMVPRDDIVALSAERSLEENLRTMRENPLTRFPLVGGSADELLGVVYVPAMLARLDGLRSGEVSLREIAVEPMWVDPETSVSELIDRFQEERQEVALVGDEGRVDGLVTVTDALEEVAGELRDPYD